MDSTTTPPCLEELVKEISSRARLFLLIDGLDEYEGDKDDLVELLSYIPSSFFNRTSLA